MSHLEGFSVSVSNGRDIRCSVRKLLVLMFVHTAQFLFLFLRQKELKFGRGTGLPAVGLGAVLSWVDVWAFEAVCVGSGVRCMLCSFGMAL